MTVVASNNARAAQTPRVRIGDWFALAGVWIAIAGLVVQVIFRVLAQEWSDGLRCESVQSSVLNVLPGIAIYAGLAGFVLGLLALATRCTKRRAAVLALVLTPVGVLMVWVVLLPYALMPCTA